LLEVVAHYANTGKVTVSPFIDSSIDKILLQTNPGRTSRFLTSQTFQNFILLSHCCITVKPCNRMTVGAHRLGQTEFMNVFSFILTRIMLGLLFPGSPKADVG